MAHCTDFAQVLMLWYCSLLVLLPRFPHNNILFKKFHARIVILRWVSAASIKIDLTQYWKSHDQQKWFPSNMLDFHVCLTVEPEFSLTIYVYQANTFFKYMSINIRPFLLLFICDDTACAPCSTFCGNNFSFLQSKLYFVFRNLFDPSCPFNVKFNSKRFFWYFLLLKGNNNFKSRYFCWIRYDW